MALAWRVLPAVAISKQPAVWDWHLGQLCNKICGIRSIDSIKFIDHRAIAPMGHAPSVAHGLTTISWVGGTGGDVLG